LLNKIKDTFTEFEQQMFVSSFYCYLNYDKTLDFVIDFDDVWKWLDFSTKQKGLRIIQKYFELNTDYINLVNQLVDHNVKQHGGHNKDRYMLNINAFKKFCIKAQTKKASDIHDYYIKMEEILQETVEEESNELRLQLEQKENMITDIIQTNEMEKLLLTKDKQKAIEETLIKQFPLNTECIYIGTIENTNEANESLIKFGHTNNLQVRLHDHHKKYDNFVLVDAFKVLNKVEIENLIKTHPKIKKQIRTVSINGKNKTEIIAYNTTNFTINTLTKYIKEIIQSKTYGIDNFNKLLAQNDALTSELSELKYQLEQQKTLIDEQTLEIHNLKETLKTQTDKLNAFNADNQSVYQNSLLPEDELTGKFNKFIATSCIVRNDVEESSTNMEGAYRIWSKVKPKKETFQALKNYLDTRFKHARITKQDKDQVVYGYIGVKLIPVKYAKKYVGNDVETFLFQVCNFAPNGKILNSVLLSEYQRWKKSLDKNCSDNDMADLKKYLNECEYVLKATVWTDQGSNEGYYGISLKQDEHKYKTTSSTGKMVNKVEVTTGVVLASWSTIAKAAETENMSATKMSRSVKNKTIFNDYYYSTKET
jgi:phage anti-repressor protein